MDLVVDIFATVGAIVILFLLWMTIIVPFIHYLKRIYIFYVLKKIRVAHYKTVYSFIFGPDSVEIITRKDFKKIYGCEAEFKHCF